MTCFSSSKKVYADNGDSAVQKIEPVLSFGIALEMGEGRRGRLMEEAISQCFG